MKKILSSTILINTIIASFAAVLLMITFLFVNPYASNFLLTLIPLLLGWVLIFSVCRAVFALFGAANQKGLKILSYTLPSAVVLILMFSALGEVSILDGFLILSLALLSNFYISRTWPN